MEGFTQRQTIELTQSNPVLVRDQPLVKGDVQALVWIVTVKKNGVPVDLTGATASLYCARALSEDESGGTTYSAATVEDDGTVKAVLPRDAANISGPVGCMIRVTRDGASVAVARMAVMAVDQTGDDILDEGKRIPSLDEIAASIARCDAAAEKAEGAAASVGDALKQVASAIEATNGAASDARGAAGQATDGASAAKAAATTATEAATKIDDMTITATGLAAGAAPTAALTEVDGHYNIVLGIPKGDKGDPGATPQITVQVKTGEPGTAASVKQTGTAEAPVIELTIPRGDTGSLGSLTINGKAPDSAGKVELTAADVRARADDWMPTAADVGALSGTDTTLTQAEKAADAKATGDMLNQLKSETVYVTGSARNVLYRGNKLDELGSEAEWATFLGKYQVPQGLFVAADNSDALYLGDYITVKNAGAYSGDWMIAGFNTHKNVGDNLDAIDGVSNAGSVNHIAMIPRGAGFEYGTKMNDTNTTVGGYAGSAMHTHLREVTVPALVGSLGKRLLTRRVLLTNVVEVGTSSPGYSGWNGTSKGWGWNSSRAELMSEVQAYGDSVWGGGFDVGEAYEKLPVFNFVSCVAFFRGSFWVRAVASESVFAGCGTNGIAGYFRPSDTVLHVRPLIMVG